MQALLLLHLTDQKSFGIKVWSNNRFGCTFATLGWKVSTFKIQRLCRYHMSSNIGEYLDRLSLLEKYLIFTYYSSLSYLWITNIGKHLDRGSLLKKYLIFAYYSSLSYLWITNIGEHLDRWSLLEKYPLIFNFRC